MKQALGLVEVQGLSTAVLVADAMVKAANVTILEIENSKGQGYMTVKVVGDVGAVNAAVSVGKQTGLENQKLVSFKVIARPADSVDQIFGAAKNTKTDAPIQPSHSAKVQMQAEKEDATAGETSVKEVIKETAKPEVEEKSEVKSEVKLENKLEVELEVKPEVEPAVKPAVKPEIKPETKPEVQLAVKPEVQLEEKLEEKTALVEQAAEEKTAQEPQAELQTEPQAGTEKVSSVNQSGAKKTAEHKTKN
ncbi:BMC domain-containing protein [Lacrimispora algidixylanolytica]|uniref:BMC domain-containing protein n=1 Tax=Lacrimispora algidixylanolytica TaxID=94868 RepID=A0A419T9B2_9FIRM|nr:BMC domain-containing protein [Lacrimispora algidixylanolytica]RKD34061.1 hypothetical protein BET01_12970 [Lacrimispora algidixylanolytica]